MEVSRLLLRPTSGRASVGCVPGPAGPGGLLGVRTARGPDRPRAVRSGGSGERPWSVRAGRMLGQGEEGKVRGALGWNPPQLGYLRWGPRAGGPAARGAPSPRVLVRCSGGGVSRCADRGAGLRVGALGPLPMAWPAPGEMRGPRAGSLGPFGGGGGRGCVRPGAREEVGVPNPVAGDDPFVVGGAPRVDPSADVGAEDREIDVAPVYVGDLPCGASCPDDLGLGLGA